MSDYDQIDMLIDTDPIKLGEEARLLIHLLGKMREGFDTNPLSYVDHGENADDVELEGSASAALLQRIDLVLARLP